MNLCVFYDHRSSRFFFTALDGDFVLPISCACENVRGMGEMENIKGNVNHERRTDFLLLITFCVCFYCRIGIELWVFGEENFYLSRSKFKCVNPVIESIIQLKSSMLPS
jgi:hypothetical protein